MLDTFKIKWCLHLFCYGTDFIFYNVTFVNIKREKNSLFLFQNFETYSNVCHSICIYINNSIDYSYNLGSNTARSRIVLYQLLSVPKYDYGRIYFGLGRSQQCQYLVYFISFQSMAYFFQPRTIFNFFVTSIRRIVTDSYFTFDSVAFIGILN